MGILSIVAAGAARDSAGGTGDRRMRVRLQEPGRRSKRIIVSVHTTIAALRALSMDGKIDPKVVTQAIKDFDIDPDRLDPVTL